MRRQEPFGGRLDGDRYQFLVALRNRRQRVGPPVPATIDTQTDSNVLPGSVIAGEAPARFDRHAGRVLGFLPNRHDLAAQFPGRPQRVEQFQIVIGQQRCSRPRHQTAQHVHLRGRRSVHVFRGRNTPSPHTADRRPHAHTPLLRPRVTAVTLQTLAGCPIPPRIKHVKRLRAASAALLPGQVHDVFDDVRVAHQVSPAVEVEHFAGDPRSLR